MIFAEVSQMSQQRGNQQQQPSHHGSTFLKTAAVFVAGAAAGALAAWFASDETENNSNQQQQNQSRPVVPNNAPATVRASVSSDDIDEKKDGVLQCCEICFLPFDEIKAHDGQIMATPCGHVFCRVCITESLRLKQECPNCRHPTVLDDLNRLYI